MYECSIALGHAECLTETAFETLVQILARNHDQNRILKSCEKAYWKSGMNYWI